MFGKVSFSSSLVPFSFSEVLFDKYLESQILFLKNIYFMCFACVHVCEPCACLLHPLELDLEMIVSHHVNTGN